MIDFTTFDIATGELLQTMRCTDIHGVDAQCSEAIDYVFGHWNRATHVVRNGEVVLRDPAALPPPTED